MIGDAMSITPVLFVLLMVAMSALPLLVVFTILFFAFDVTGEIGNRRPQRMKRGRSAERTRKKI